MGKGDIKEMTLTSSGHLFGHFISFLGPCCLIGALLVSSVKDPLMVQPMEGFHWLSYRKVQGDQE